MKEFEAFATEHSKGMAIRVFLSVIKVSDGDYELVPDLVEKAKRDGRDVISMGEYPNQFKLGVGADEKAKRKAKREDKRQYNRWLK